MKRAIITGHAGFTGRHLANHLQSLGYAVSGIGRSDGVDIQDASAVAANVRASQPNVVFHLAAAPKSANASELYSVNVLGTVNLLDALVGLDQMPVVVVVSSSAVYGRTHHSRPVSERIQPRPVTQYGASKLAQELVALRYLDAHGLPLIRVRAFNLLGPGLPDDLACGAFADAIVRRERSGSPEPIRTGNLNSSRDFTDVRDVVRAYAMAAEHGRPGAVYNVCSGTMVSLKYCLEVLIGLASRPIATELDPERLQANDVPAQVGDSTRLRALTGWLPAISVERSLADMLIHRRQEKAA